MKGCRKTQSELAAFFYGDLGERQHAEVEAHLRQCPACRARLAEFAELLATVDEVAPDYQVEQDAGPAFTDSVMSRIRQEEQETVSEKAPSPPWWWNLKPCAATSASPAASSWRKPS